MKRYAQTYLISRDTSTLNRKVKKGSDVYLNHFLLQPGHDFTIGKRNVKFAIPLFKGDVIIIEEKEC